ncbi:hypothetical protein SUDANB121_00523 [Nocardiopsis dassonvillei]|uniref:hypothetical protein n=1 Tax=Nocardiopsis dassonvillei TaxID=2014 RepID=UPI003F57202B
MPIYDYLAAADDTAAASLLEADLDDAGVPWLFTKGVDPAVEPNGLEAALAGPPAPGAGPDPRAAALLTDPGHEGRWMLTLTDRLRDALAEASAQDLARAAAVWAAREDLFPGGADTPGPADFVEGLAGLARTAASRGHRLYCRAVL